MDFMYHSLSQAMHTYSENLKMFRYTQCLQLKMSHVILLVSYLFDKLLFSNVYPA